METRREFLTKLAAASAASAPFSTFSLAIPATGPRGGGATLSPAAEQDLRDGALYRSPKIYYGVCYYPEAWDESRWETDVQMMREAGFNIARLA